MRQFENLELKMDLTAKARKGFHKGAQRIFPYVPPMCPIVPMW
jgi:hypothetical protein